MRTMNRSSQLVPRRTTAKRRHLQYSVACRDKVFKGCFEPTIAMHDAALNERTLPRFCEGVTDHSHNVNSSIIPNFPLLFLSDHRPDILTPPAPPADYVYGVNRRFYLAIFGLGSACFASQLSLKSIRGLLGFAVLSAPMPFCVVAASALLLAS